MGPMENVKEVLHVIEGEYLSHGVKKKEMRCWNL